MNEKIQRVKDAMAKHKTLKRGHTGKTNLNFGELKEYVESHDEILNALVDSLI